MIVLDVAIIAWIVCEVIYTFNLILCRSGIIFFIMAPQPPVGQGLLVVDDSRSHSDTPHSVGLLWTSDQPGAETLT
jgi:hypothetical protein